MLQPNFSTDPPLILIVEDDPTMCLLYRRVLSRESYEVQEAGNGEICLEICSHSVPDLILLDAKMPTMDGFTCCEELQKKLGTDCPPIMIVTVLNDEESVELAFEKGATEYISKPINWAVFRQRIYRLLKTSWAFQELQRRHQKAEELSQELERANQQLKILATVDGLTQVANRRRFDERLQEEWYRARREKLPLSLIICDIDYFKRYNDYYGHQNGDACLKQVASILQENCQRTEDFVARYGGEEFVIVLAGVTLEQANCLAQRMNNQLQEAAIPHEMNPNCPYVTLSMGIASMVPQPNTTEADLVAQGDRALYEAKKQGRDCIVSTVKQ